MNAHNPKSGSRKSFLSFGVLSPQDRRQEQELLTQETITQKASQQIRFKDWKLKRYGLKNFLRRLQ
jgi:hypothetical protein